MSAAITFDGSESGSFVQSEDPSARNLAGITYPPEADGPWWKMVYASASGAGWKGWKSWEEHTESDDDFSLVTWVEEKWSWLANGADPASAPAVEEYTDTLLLRELWESTVTGPSGSTATIRHNTKLGAYGGGYTVDQWLCRIGEGPWQAFNPGGGLSVYDWLYMQMTVDQGLGTLYVRNRTVDVSGSEVSGTETYTWNASETWPSGATTSWTTTYSRYNNPEDNWSVNALDTSAQYMLNSINFDSMETNTCLVLSLDGSGAVVQEAGVLPDVVTEDFPWSGDWKIVGSGSKAGLSSPASATTVSFMKSRVSWPSDPDQIHNQYATATRAFQPGIPATSAYPGPDNSVAPHFEDFRYNPFDASANMKASFAISLGEIYLGRAGLIPSESTAGPLSTGSGPTSTQ